MKNIFGRFSCGFVFSHGSTLFALVATVASVCAVTSPALAQTPTPSPQQTETATAGSETLSEPSVAIDADSGAVRPAKQLSMTHLPAPTPPLVFPPVRAGGALDAYIPLPVQNSAPDSDRFRVRSIDVWGTAQIDDGWQARLRVGTNDDLGPLEVRLLDAHIESATLMQNLKVRLGHFALGVGLINSLRPSEWPFPDPSRSHQKFFSSIGVRDSGVEVDWQPLGTDAFELRLGITNGYTFGNEPTGVGTRPLTPTHYLRPAFRFGQSNDARFKFAVDYLSRTDQDSLKLTLSGLDFLYCEKCDSTNDLPEHLIMSEIFHRSQTSAYVPLVEDLGGYIYIQGSTSDRAALGLKIEGYTISTLTQPDGSKRNNFDYGFSPVMTFATNKHSRVRFAYSLLNETREGDSDRIVQKFELQFAAFLGERMMSLF